MPKAKPPAPPSRHKRKVGIGHLPMMKRILARISHTDLHWLNSMDTQELKALLDLIQSERRPGNVPGERFRRERAEPWLKRLDIATLLEEHGPPLHRTGSELSGAGSARPTHTPDPPARTKNPDPTGAKTSPATSRQSPQGCTRHPCPFSPVMSPGRCAPDPASRDSGPLAGPIRHKPDNSRNARGGSIPPPPSPLGSARRRLDGSPGAIARHAGSLPTPFLYLSIRRNQIVDNESAERQNAAHAVWADRHFGV